MLPIRGCRVDRIGDLRGVFWLPADGPEGQNHCDQRFFRLQPCGNLHTIGPLNPTAVGDLSEPLPSGRRTPDTTPDTPRTTGGTSDQ